MNTGSKLGCYNSLPLRITPSLVVQYLGMHIQFICRKLFFSYLPYILSFTLNLQDQVLGFPKVLLLVLILQLIHRSGNFMDASLLMFPCWEVSNAMMSSTFPTFH